LQKLNLDEIITSLEKQNLIIDKNFLNTDESELKVAILQQMDIFLNAIDDKGLKLTTKGNLPTALVKEITLVNPSYQEKRFLHFTKRFIEDESMPTQRARILAKHLKFIRTSKNRLFLTNKAKAYQTLRASEKFLVLLESFLSLNLGYFDGYEPFDLLNQIAPLYLYAIAEENASYRTVEYYDNLFFTKNAHLEMSIILALFKEITISLDETESLKSKEELLKTGKKHFSPYVKLRLFERFFAIFGLIEERGDRYNKELEELEPYEAKKTSLLDKLINPHEVVDKNLLLTKKMVHSFKNEIQEKSLHIENLFHDFAYLMSTLANYPFPSTSVVVEDIIKQRMIIGTQATNQTQLYTRFYEGLKTAMLLFTQYAMNGLEKEQLKKMFEDFIDAIVLLVDIKKKPFVIYKEFEIMSMFLFDVFTKEYGIDLQREKPDEIMAQHFNQEVSEDVKLFFYHLSLLQKQSKKLKRISTEYKLLIKDTIQSYILAIFSLYTYQLEHKIIQEDESMPVPQSDEFTEKILEFKITLQGINNPVIYRTIQIPSNFTFYDLHVIIQSAFNWEDAHLFEFMIKKKRIGDYKDEFGEENLLSAREILLEDEFQRKAQKALYIYDFGDNWEHEIVLQKSFEPQKGKKYPVCIEAQGNTPPEDVGGVWGFESFKEIMKDKNHSEYLEMREWYDHEYDENYCSINKINAMLQGAY